MVVTMMQIAFTLTSSIANLNGQQLNASNVYLMINVQEIYLLSPIARTICVQMLILTTIAARSSVLWITLVKAKTTVNAIHKHTLANNAQTTAHVDTCLMTILDSVEVELALINPIRLLKYRRTT